MIRKEHLQVFPSLLSADFAQLGKEVQSLEEAGADGIHLDVMDGRFVPELTFGPALVRSIRAWTQLSLDCHLMVSNPEQWILPFAEAGATHLTVHVEATHHLDRILNTIVAAGCTAGVSLNPGTSLTSIEEVLHKVNSVLVMTVNPGWGGQEWIPSMLNKVKKLELLQKEHSFSIQVDGGITVDNIGVLSAAGANIFVAGQSVLGQSDRRKAIQALRQAAFHE